MAEMSDRERLEQLAREKEAARVAAESERRRQEADEHSLRLEEVEADRQKTAELLAYCQSQYGGFKLVPTGHEVSVDKAGSSRLFNVTPDGVEYVQFNVTHWGDETGDFQGLIPVVLARVRKGRHELLYGDVRTTFQTFEELRAGLLEALSSLNSEHMGRVFGRVRDMRR